MANADGATVGACGNGTRCVAALLLEELQQDKVTLETDSGLVSATTAAPGMTTVDMGPAYLAWDDHRAWQLLREGAANGEPQARASRAARRAALRRCPRR